MTVKAMLAVTLPGMAAANAVAVMAAVAAALEVSAVIVRKVAQRAEQRVEATSAVNVVLINEALSRAANSAMIYEANNVLNNVVKARRRVSHAHRASRVNRVNHARAVARSAHAVNAVSEATSRAHRLMPPSKTSHWPTRPPWLRPWAAGQQTRARKPRAVSVVIAVAAVLSHAQSHAPTLKMRRVKIANYSVTRRLSKPSAWTSMHLLKAAPPAIRPVHNVRRVSHASAAAVTVTAAIAANALRVLISVKTALKLLL
jgi:hypothetical protein